MRGSPSWRVSFVTCLLAPLEVNHPSFYLFPLFHLLTPLLIGTVKEEHQVRLWRRLINFEKTNPQRLDPAALRARITFTYNQCLLCLYHYPDMWLEFANYQVCFCLVGFCYFYVIIIWKTTENGKVRADFNCKHLKIYGQVFMFSICHKLFLLVWLSFSLVTLYNIIIFLNLYPAILDSPPLV